MPIIGNPIYQSAFVVDQFNGDGSTVAFTMSVAPAGVTNVLVAVSGVLQDPSTYGVVGNTITFSAAPPTGTGNISCRYLGIPVTGVTTTAYRTVTEFTATASQTTFTPPSYTVGFINVYLNGVLLGSADYTASNGTTVVLATGASAGNLVTVESFQISSVANAIPNAAGSVSSSNIVTGGVTDSKLSLTTPALGTPSALVLTNATGLPASAMATGAAATNLSTASASTYYVRYMVIAGGGGGGSHVGGGAGAGGYIAGNTTLTSGTGYTVTIGAGGNGSTDTSGTGGTNGGNSVFGAITATGGGRGGSGYITGFAGGSGGGCGHGTGTANYSTGTGGGTPTANQGSYGGGGNQSGQHAGGGGGGAGSIGISGANGGDIGGDGGNGVFNDITGTGLYWAGGGGGSSGVGGTARSGNGGAGGGGGAGSETPSQPGKGSLLGLNAGGDGSVSGSAAGGNGGANTGGGGGGGSHNNGDGGAGGSGIVVIRYSGAQRGTGGTVTSVNGDTVHTFLSSGTYTA